MQTRNQFTPFRNEQIKKLTHAHCFCNHFTSELANLLNMYDELWTLRFFHRKVEARRFGCFFFIHFDSLLRHKVFAIQKRFLSKNLVFFWLEIDEMHWNYWNFREWTKTECKKRRKDTDARSTICRKRNFHFTKTHAVGLQLLFHRFASTIAKTCAKEKLIKTDMHMICAWIACKFAYESTHRPNQYKSFVRIKNYQIYLIVFLFQHLQRPIDVGPSQNENKNSRCHSTTTEPKRICHSMCQCAAIADQFSTNDLLMIK